MSEANSAVVQEKPRRKRRSLWWLNLLLTLVVFAGGIILGLMLHKLSGPYVLVERYFPQLIAYTAVPASETAPLPTPAVTPEPTAAPEPTPAPEPTAAPAEVSEAEPAAEAPKAEESAVEEAVAEEPTAEEPAAEEPAAESPAEAESAVPAVAAEKKPIGVNAALAAALERAKADADKAEVYGVFKTTDDGVTVYQVEFAADGVEYVTFVNALTGEIEGWRTVRAAAQPSAEEPEDEAVQETEQEPAISEDEARSIAFRDAGVKVFDVTDVSSELLGKDGRSWYEIVFKADGQRYTFRVDAASGQVLFRNKAK